MLCPLLTNCGGQDNKKDLVTYVKQVKARPGQPVDALPRSRPLKPYFFAGVGKRNPFRPVLSKHMAKPDQDRQKEELEAFSLDSLSMVGHFQVDGRFYAIITAPDGTVHRIHKGQYMGLRDGKVVKITPEKIEIEELIPLDVGWEKRGVTLVIDDQEDQSKQQ